MQDNEPLMRALTKLIKVNEPDLVLFVGEALVGNEAVDQLVKFNQALADYSSTTSPHLIDGIVLTKFDTIDDKVIFIFNCKVFLNNIFLKKNIKCYKNKQKKVKDKRK